jgi:hypothetical protein
VFGEQRQSRWVRTSIMIVVDRTLTRAACPLFLAVSLYLAVLTASLLLSLRVSGGRFVYPLDDTYIAMAMAKHFAAHWVWGVTP